MWTIWFYKQTQRYTTSQDVIGARITYQTGLNSCTIALGLLEFKRRAQRTTFCRGTGCFSHAHFPVKIVNLPLTIGGFRHCFCGVLTATGLLKTRNTASASLEHIHSMSRRRTCGTGTDVMHSILPAGCRVSKPPRRERIIHRGAEHDREFSATCRWHSGVPKAEQDTFCRSVRLS